MWGLRSGGRGGVQVAVAGIAAGLSVAAVVVVLVLHPWNRTVATLTIHIAQTDAHSHTGLVTEPVIHAFRQDPRPGSEVIRVDSAVRDQTIDGFGAAMTDTSAWLLHDKLAPATFKHQLQDLFSTAGIHLTSILIPMGASDFTKDGTPYSYDEVPKGASDPKLRHFSVAHDNPYIIPTLQDALQINDSLSFIAVPWSMPAWMKTNDRLSNKHNSGTLKPADYQAYANYFVTFLLKYSAHGISVGEVAPANEPGTATSYPGMNISAQTENTLIEKYLAPTINRRGLATQIYGSDLGWGQQAYARSIATGSAAQDLAGIAWHCYYGSPSAMSRIQALDPKLGVQVTECSPGISTVPESEVVIESLRNHASVVDLWNLALDDRGGPVQPPNHGCPGCYGLLRVDTRTGAVHRTSAYYDLGQASKFIEPNARRVQSNTFVRYHYTGPGRDYVSANVDDVAVRNPDGSMVVMAYNNATTAKRITVTWRGYEFGYTVGAGATVTFHWRPNR